MGLLETFQTAPTLPYLESVIMFQIVVYLFSTYLDFRQLKSITKKTIPKEVASTVSADEYTTKVRPYSLDKFYFKLVHDFYSVATGLASLYLGLLPWMWGAAGAALDASRVAIASDRTREIAQTLVFFFLFYLFSTISEVPWSLYSQFVVEQQHGFNNMTLGLFVSDMLKSTALVCVVFGPPVVAGVTYILQRSSPWLALHLWAFVFVLSIFMLIIYPVAIAPLFNKFDPLPEGPLRTSIEALASSLKFPLTKLFVTDGSKRSSHSNAYMYGFWKNKRIVLYDTLLKHCSEKQIVAVLAHELGHWARGHTLKMFGIQEVLLLIQFSTYTLIKADPRAMVSFGFSEDKHGHPAFLTLVIFTYIFSPVNEVVSFMSHIVSRAFEREADSFAVDLGHSAELTGALLSLSKENKSNPNVDAWYSAYHYTHPPIVERIQFIEAEEKKRK